MLLLGDLLRRCAEVRPDQVAVTYEENSLTFEQMNSLVNQFANALIGCGVKRGDRIGLLLTNSHLFEVAYFASIKTGSIFVPICFWYKEQEIDYVVKKAGITILSLGEDFINTIRGMKDDLKTVRQYIVIGESSPDGMTNFHELISGFPQDEPNVTMDEHDPHLILFTSGTTGVPKGAVISQRNYFLHTGIFIQYMGIREQDVSMCVYPLFHMGGIMWLVANAYARNHLIIISTPPTPKKILGAIQRHHVTHFAAVPTLWRDYWNIRISIN